MKNGRINERNIGNHKLDGGAKRIKLVTGPILTDEQYKAKESIRLCNMILNDSIRLYENIPELVQNWINTGIVEVKEIENPWAYSKQFYPTIKVVYLVEKHRNEVELLKEQLLIM